MKQIERLDEALMMLRVRADTLAVWYSLEPYMKRLDEAWAELKDVIVPLYDAEKSVGA